MKHPFWIWVLAVWPVQLAAGDTIHLTRGHQRVLPAEGVERIAVGNPAVADVKVLPDARQMIVTGIGNGSTDLILWFKNGEKRSYPVRVGGAGKDDGGIRKLLEGMEGVTLREMNGKPVLDGQIYSAEDLERVHRIVRLYPGTADLTRVNRQALEYFGRRAEAELRRAGLTSVRVRPAGETLFLEGEVAGKAEEELAERVARAVYPAVSKRLSRGIESGRMILVDVKMTEIRKNAASQAGIRWPGQIEATGSAVFSSGAPASASVNTGAALSLSALVEKGLAKILSNPKLLCRSGTPASFLAGGEIPIRLISERSASITFKPYGVSLEVKAKADRAGKVSMEIETKVSDLDQATAIDNIPGILEHRVKTAADLRFGETVVLGGLFENRAKKNIQKIPFLGHIPVLGELFKSRSFQQNESEFLIFLTPQPAGADSYVHDQFKKGAKYATDKAAGEMEFSILD